jgi:SAM-dependent methyltransferase
MAGAPVAVHQSNARAQRDWDADAEFLAENDARFDINLSGYEQHLLTAANISTGESVLDVGCGTGPTTRNAALLAVGGTSVGIDLSPAMIAQARRRTREQGLRNVDFIVGDAQIYPFDPSSVDVAVSRMGTLFFGDPGMAFHNIRRALRPNGRIAITVWQSMSVNEWIQELSRTLLDDPTPPQPPPGTPGPFAMADAEWARAILEMAGFHDIAVMAVSEPLVFGTDVDDAYNFVTAFGLPKGLLQILTAGAALKAEADLRESLAAHAGPRGVAYGSAAWIITAKSAQTTH